MKSLIIGNVLTIATMFAWWLFKDIDYKVDIFMFSNDTEYPKFIAHDIGLLLTNVVLYLSINKLISKEYKPITVLFVLFSVFRVIEYILFHGNTDMLPVAASVTGSIMTYLIFIKPAK